MTEVEADWERLRRPFDPAQINQLPRGPVMIDYVGHAYVTERLNECDPGWVMCPGAVEHHGDMAYMKVSLTVHGVTRHEIGCADTNKDEWPKLLYSDCLTRAAMRFGVGLDLWKKLGGGRGEVDRPRTRAAAPIPKDIGPPLKDLFDLAKNRVQALSTDGGKAEWEDFKQEVDWEARWRAGTIDRNLVEMALRTLAEILANERTALGEEPW